MTDRRRYDQCALCGGRIITVQPFGECQECGHRVLRGTCAEAGSPAPAPKVEPGPRCGALHTVTCAEELNYGVLDAPAVRAGDIAACERPAHLDGRHAGRLPNGRLISWPGLPKGAPIPTVPYLAYDPREMCLGCGKDALGPPLGVHGGLDFITMERQCTACGRAARTRVATKKVETFTMRTEHVTRCGDVSPHHDTVTCELPKGHTTDLHQATLGSGVLSWPVAPAPTVASLQAEIKRLRSELIKALSAEVSADTRAECERHARDAAEFACQKAKIDLAHAEFRARMAEAGERAANALLRPAPAEPTPEQRSRWRLGIF